MAPLIVLAAVLTIALVAMVVLAWPEIRLRYVPRRAVDAEECEVCGKRSRSNVTLTSAPKQRVVDGMLGGSCISATFCAEHLPD